MTKTPPKPVFPKPLVPQAAIQRKPSVPPAYRPATAPRTLPPSAPSLAQRGAGAPLVPQAAIQRKPSVPPAFRPHAGALCLQRKPGPAAPLARAIQRASMSSGSSPGGGGGGKKGDGEEEKVTKAIAKLASKPPQRQWPGLTMPRALRDDLEILVAELGMGMSADYAPDAVLSTEQAEHRVFVSEAYAGIQAMIRQIFETDEDAFNALSMSGFLHAFFHIPMEQCNQTTSQQLLNILGRIKPS